VPLFGWRTKYWSFLLKLAKNGKNAGESLTRTTGTSVGDSTTYRGLLGFWPQSRNYQGGASRSRAKSRSFGWSTSKSDSRSQSNSDSSSFSRSASSSRSITEGWGDTIHKRLLLNPDEIGRFLARIDDTQHPAHPGVVLALIPGEHPLPVHRVNYFASHWFDAFFDPHPDHPPPPTIPERIRQIAAAKTAELPAPEKRRLFTLRRAAAIAATIMMIAGVGWWSLGMRSLRPMPVADSTSAAGPNPMPVAGSTSGTANAGDGLRSPSALLAPPSAGPTTSSPSSQGCGGNSDARVEEPVLSLFDAMRRLDLRAYASPWAEFATLNE
jgi:hypothetical protein